jgi:hypothetical protein
VPSLHAHLVAVPDVGPPYDCDIHGTTCQAPTDPPAAGPALSRRPAPRAPVPQVPVSQAPAACAGAVWPRQFAQAIVETLAGTRPIRQIVPWTTDRSQAHIRTLCPLFRTDSGPRIARVLSSFPSADVVEVTVIAGFGARTRALAMRFEYIAARQPAPGLPARPARWLCTDVEAG